MKKTMFPREFVEWIGENELYRNKGKDGKWIFQVDPYIIWKSTDELYQYWRLEIEPKTKEERDIVLKKLFIRKEDENK